MVNISLDALKKSSKKKETRIKKEIVKVFRAAGAVGVTGSRGHRPPVLNQDKKCPFKVLSLVILPSSRRDCVKSRRGPAK